MTIRELEPKDLETRVLWMNNPGIYSSMHLELPITLEKTMAWYEKNRGNDRRMDFAIEDEGEVVAFCGITNIDPTIKRGESYTFVNPYNHAKGIGTEAKRLMIDYGFRKMGLRKLISITNEDNAGSNRINEKLGYTLEGRLRGELAKPNGEYKDRLYWGLLAEEWTAGLQK